MARRGSVAALFTAVLLSLVGLVGLACDSLAHTYYQAVHVFGSVVVTQSDLDRAAAIMHSGVAPAAAA
jgi:hypothetical protein